MVKKTQQECSSDVEHTDYLWDFSIAASRNL